MLYNSYSMKKIDRLMAWATFLSGIFIVGSSLRMNRFVRQRLEQSGKSEYTPRVALMVPCKDVDPDFIENMQMLLRQDYPDYEVIFMTVSPEDPCHRHLKDCVAASQVPARIVFGGFSRKRCQKLDNMLAGIDALADSEHEDPHKPRAEVYIWADSDARVPRNWLREMVAPLEDPEVGVSSTYRFYRPLPGRPLSYLLALWTGYQFCHMHLRKVMAVWGGSMAIRRELFDTLEIRKVWDTALSDDCVLHNTVLKAGKRIDFALPAMTTASSDLSTREILIFAMRQCIIGKVVLKDIWIVSVLSLSLYHLSYGRGLFLAAKHLKQRKALPGYVWGMLSFLVAGTLQAAGYLNALKKIETHRQAHDMSEDPLHIERRWALAGPLAYLFLWWSLLGSVFRKKFSWRAIHYHMKSEHATDVLRYPKALDRVQERVVSTHILRSIHDESGNP